MNDWMIKNKNKKNKNITFIHQWFFFLKKRKLNEKNKNNKKKNNQIKKIDLQNKNSKKKMDAYYLKYFSKINVIQIQFEI